MKHRDLIIRINWREEGCKFNSWLREDLVLPLAPLFMCFKDNTLIYYLTWGNILLRIISAYFMVTNFSGGRKFRSGIPLQRLVLLSQITWPVTEVRTLVWKNSSLLCCCLVNAWWWWWGIFVYYHQGPESLNCGVTASWYLVSKFNKL